MYGEPCQARGEQRGLRHAQHQSQCDQLPERACHCGGRGHHAPCHEADGQEALDAEAIDGQPGGDLHDGVAPEKDRIEHAAACVG